MTRKDDRPERQHYAPQFLLRGFLAEPREKEQLFVFDKHEDRSFKTNTANVATERDFYEVGMEHEGKSLETLLAEMEGNTKAAVDRLVETESLAALDLGQRSWLPVFLAVQQLRTRMMREVIQFLNDGAANHVRKMGFDPREAKGFRPIEDEVDLKAEAIAHMLGSLHKNSEVLQSKAAFLARTSPDRPFWISDHPVV